MHLQKFVQVADLLAGTGGNTFLTAGLQQLWVGAFFLGHRLDQGDLALDDGVIHAGVLHLLGHFAHAGHHAHDAFHAAHLEHLFQLHLQVVHVELTFGEALHHPLGLFGLDGFLRFFHQGNDVAHAKDTARDPVRLKGFERVHLFAKADVFDRLAGHGTHRQRCTAAAVTVHPGQDNAGDADLVVELLGHLNSDLTGQTVNHQEGFARADNVTDVLNLFHQHFVDLQTASGVQHIDVIAAHGGLLLGAFGDINRGLTRHDRQGVHTDLLTQNGQLIHRRRAINVERGQEHALAVFFFQTFGQLTGGGGFTRALQTDHQDRGRRVVDL